jgi:hypothetical protein
MYQSLRGEKDPGQRRNKRERKENARPSRHDSAGEDDDNSWNETQDLEGARNSKDTETCETREEDG